MHVNGDDKVTGGTAALTRGSLAGQSDALSVLHARRNPCAQGPSGDRLPGPGAGVARVVDEKSTTPALPTGLSEGEAARVAALAAGPTADRADARRGSRLRAAAVTGRTGRRCRQLQGDRGTAGRVVEGQRHLGLEISTTTRRLRAAAPPSATEDGAEDVT